MREPGEFAVPTNPTLRFTAYCPLLTGYVLLLTPYVLHSRYAA
jgi:hypothetical protein